MVLKLLMLSFLSQPVSSFQLLIDSNNQSRRESSHHGLLLEAEVARKLEVIDRTVASVENAVDLVNQTAQKVMTHGLNASRSLSLAFLESKTNALSLKSVLGEDISSSGELFFERLGQALDPMPEHFMQSDAKMQSILRDILMQFRLVGNSSKELFGTAGAAVVKLSSLQSFHIKKEQVLLLEINEVTAGSVEMAERTEAEGIIDWFSKTFGEGRTPCGHARRAVSDADQSVDRMSGMLLELNTTFCSNLLEGAVKSIKETHFQVEQVMKTGVATYGAKLPSTVLATVASSVGATGDLVDRMHTKVAYFEDQIAAALRLAIKHVSTLHEVSGALFASVDEACNDKL